MSHLPDNLEDWPDSPIDVLGIEAGASSKDIRRAYVRLIRRFTPDDHPEHFQRIRQCYELIDSGWGQHFYSLRPNNDSFEQDSAARELDSSDDSDEDLYDRDVELSDDYQTRREQIYADEQGEPRQGNSVDRQHSLAYVWELIDEGRFEQARLKLESPTSLDSFAADERHSGEFLLYYLYLITTPNNSLEKRISLLLKIIERDTYRYAATERLSEEALRDKRVIQMEVFLNFVKNCRNPELVDAIYRIRWSVLGVDGYMTIINDVNWLQKRALDIGESRLMDLMRLSIDYTIWNVHRADVKEHYDYCYQEACQYRGNEYGQFEVADSMEFMYEMWGEWHAMKRREVGGIARCATAMVPLARIAGERELRECWHESSKLIRFHRSQLLNTLDNLYSHFPLAMHLFENAMKQLSSTVTEVSMMELPHDDAVELVISFFSHQGSNHYDAMRIPILTFCFENAFPLNYFARLADENVMDLSASEENGWYDHVSQDVPLHCALAMELVND